MEVSTKPKVLIVEDELLTAEELKSLLSRNYEVVGIAPSVPKAEAMLSKELPDLALIDISIRGKYDGIDLAKKINEDYHIPFIFLTSHVGKDFLSRAKKVRPHAYLLKPLNAHEIPIAIELALSNYEKATSETPLTSVSAKDTEHRVMNLRDSLFLKHKNTFHRVRLNEVTFLKAHNNYTIVYTRDNHFTYSTVLRKIEEKLPIDQFIRVHRSYVVSLSAIDGYEGNMLLIGSTEIPVSKRHRDEVFELFKGV